MAKKKPSLILVDEPTKDWYSIKQSKFIKNDWKSIADAIDMQLKRLEFSKVRHQRCVGLWKISKDVPKATLAHIMHNIGMALSDRVEVIVPPSLRQLVRDRAWERVDASSVVAQRIEAMKAEREEMRTALRKKNKAIRLLEKANRVLA